MLEKNCWAGLEEYFNSLIKALTVECEEGNGSGGLKRKTRKRRRATGVGAALQTHTSEHISVNHQISPSNLSHNHGKIMQYFATILVIYRMNLNLCPNVLSWKMNILLSFTLFLQL